MDGYVALSPLSLKAFFMRLKVMGNAFLPGFLHLLRDGSLLL